VLADDERQRKEEPRSARRSRRRRAGRLPQGVSGTAPVDTDRHRRRRGKTRHPEVSRQSEGLFTELESAMDAASGHLLSTETIVDTSSPGDMSNVDCMVSPPSLSELYNQKLLHT